MAASVITPSKNDGYKLLARKAQGSGAEVVDATLTVSRDGYLRALYIQDIQAVPANFTEDVLIYKHDPDLDLDILIGRINFSANNATNGYYIWTPDTDPPHWLRSGDTLKIAGTAGDIHEYAIRAEIVATPT